MSSVHGLTVNVMHRGQRLKATLVRGVLSSNELPPEVVSAIQANIVAYKHDDAVEVGGETYQYKIKFLTQR